MEIKTLFNDVIEDRNTRKTIIFYFNFNILPTIFIRFTQFKKYKLYLDLLLLTGTSESEHCGGLLLRYRGARTGGDPDLDLLKLKPFISITIFGSYAYVHLIWITFFRIDWLGKVANDFAIMVWQQRLIYAPCPKTDCEIGICTVCDAFLPYPTKLIGS